jgi:hypothetical protein
VLTSSPRPALKALVVLLVVWSVYGLKGYATKASADFDIETAVRSYFADIPVMIEIARCESGFRQFDAAGNALDGGAGGMIGVFQIHERSHQAEANALGLDIRTREGNLAYARHLYEAEGTDPWISAYPCWNRSVISQTLAFPTDENTLQSDLTFGMEHSEVRALQKLLNKAGFVLADSGPGSPGNETTKFGALTRAAVRKFQCAKSIACDGDEYKTTYGLVDKRTREALLAFGALDVAAAEDQKQTTNDPSDIDSLEKQIAELTKIVAELQQKLSLLATN